PAPTHTYPLSLHDALPISGECARSARCPLGTNADRLSAVRERSGYLLQPFHLLPQARLDERTGRTGCLARSALVSGSHRSAACRSEEHTSELQSRENLVCR